jgi:peptide/nickel transport system substrate-binding protein
MVDGRLPIFTGGWIEDIHDPHNWAQPFLVGTYADRQRMPAELWEQFRALVEAGAALTDPGERASVYAGLGLLDFTLAPAIRLAVPTGRHYEQRWVQGWFYNPGFSGAYYYALSEW